MSVRKLFPQDSPEHERNRPVPVSRGSTASRAAILNAVSKSVGFCNTISIKLAAACRYPDYSLSPGGTSPEAGPAGTSEEKRTVSPPPTGRDEEAEHVYVEALRFWEQTAGDFPDVPGYRTTLSGVQLAYAQALMESGRAHDAAQLMAQVEPRTAEEYLWRGQVSRKLGELDKALADYDKAVELGLENAWLFRDRGEIHCAYGTESHGEPQVFTWEVTDPPDMITADGDPATGARGVGSVSVKIWHDGELIHEASSAYDEPDAPDSVYGSFNFDSYGLGTFTIDVTATDDNDDWDNPNTPGPDDALAATPASRSVEVTNDDPVAFPGVNQIVDEGAAVLFDGSGSFDADGDALSYSWDFGDPVDLTPGSGPTPSHVYTDNGTYQVTLTVDDGFGGLAMTR